MDHLFMKPSVRKKIQDLFFEFGAIQILPGSKLWSKRLQRHFPVIVTSQGFFDDVRRNPFSAEFICQGESGFGLPASSTVDEPFGECLIIQICRLNEFFDNGPCGVFVHLFLFQMLIHLENGSGPSTQKGQGRSESGFNGFGSGHPGPCLSVRHRSVYPVI